MIKEELIILSGKGCPGCEVLERKLGDKVPVYDGKVVIGCKDKKFEFEEKE